MLHFKKFFSLLCNLSLFLNVFLAYLNFDVNPINAVVDPYPVTISYASADSKLNFTPNITGDIPYHLFYKTNSKTEIDSVAGSKLPEFLYVGTCSDDSCLPQDLNSGILKTQNGLNFYYQYFTLDNTIFNIIKEGSSTQLELTSSENNLLNNVPDIPILISPIGFTNDNTPLMQWDDVAGATGYYYRVKYNCSNIDDSNTCKSVYPNTVGLWRTSSEYQAGPTSDGVYYWQVQACNSTDNCSNWPDLSKIIIDTNPPSTPSNLNYSTTNGTVLGCGGITNQYTIVAKWNTSADTNFSHYEYKSFNPTTGWVYNGGNIGNNTSRTGTFSVGEGTYGFAVRAVDKAGNFSNWTSDNLINSCQITYDATPPSVAITTPMEGYTLKGIVDISGTVTEENPHLYWLAIYRKSDGKEIYSNVVNHSGSINGLIYSWNTLGLNDGEYQIKFAERDAADNRSTDFIVNVMIDNTPPKAPLLIGDSTIYIKPGLVTRSWKASDSTDVVEYIYKSFISEAYANEPDTSPSWTPAATPSILGKTEYSRTDNTGDYERTFWWRVAAVDAAGNKSWSEIHKVIVDKTSPLLNISNSYISLDKKLSFDIDASDKVSGSGLKHVAVNIYNENNSGSALISIGRINTPDSGFPVGTYLFTKQLDNIDVSVLTSGIYTIRAAARDYSDNLTYDTLKFTVDNTAPTTTINSPTDSQYFNDTIEITGITQDANGVSSVNLSYSPYINGICSDTYLPITTIIGDSSTSFSWSYDWTPTTEGIYCLKAAGVDIAGNSEDSSIVKNIVFDISIPQVSISLNPVDPDASNGWYKTQPTITLTQTDDNFDRIEYQWDSQTGIWTNYNDTPFKLNDEGSHVLYYRAIDKANNIFPVGIKNIAWDQTDLEYGPQNISANPNPTSGSTSKIKWDIAKDNTGIDKYEVQWSLNGVNYSKTVGAGTNEVEVDKLTEGNWNVKVVAFDQSGRSKDGSINLQVDRTGPTAPTLSLAGTTAGTATLSWSAIADAKDYIIWYGNAPGSRLYGARVGNVTTYTVGGLGAGNYYFIVKAVDEAQNQGPESNEVNTGTIAGAVNVETGTPATGFTPEVLGETTTNNITSSPTPTLSSPVSDVLGVSNEKGMTPLWWWLWLLLLIPIYLILRRLFKSNRND